MKPARVTALSPAPVGLGNASAAQGEFAGLPGSPQVPGTAQRAPGAPQWSPTKPPSSQTTPGPRVAQKPTPRATADIRFVRLLGRLVRGVGYTLLHFDDVYVLARSFLFTLAGGFVSHEVEARRRAHCDGRLGQACGGRRTIQGRQYCVVESCRCPRSRWWPFSQLRWKRRFRGWRCPLGKFPAERAWWRRP